MSRQVQGTALTPRNNTIPQSATVNGLYTQQDYDICAHLVNEGEKIVAIYRFSPKAKDTLPKGIFGPLCLRTNLALPGLGLVIGILGAPCLFQSYKATQQFVEDALYILTNRNVILYAPNYDPPSLAQCANDFEENPQYIPWTSVTKVSVDPVGPGCCWKTPAVILTLNELVIANRRAFMKTVNLHVENMAQCAQICRNSMGQDVAVVLALAVVSEQPSRSSAPQHSTPQQHQNSAPPAYTQQAQPARKYDVNTGRLLEVSSAPTPAPAPAPAPAPTPAPAPAPVRLYVAINSNPTSFSIFILKSTSNDDWLIFLNDVKTKFNIPNRFKLVLAANQVSINDPLHLTAEDKILVIPKN